ncbi:hypothetical protein PV04_05866 [Phialophora macrospora]|uniref:NAD-dependent epimerase/dehydratase domain-containing protein n=1 Tax=Phialophora macrospora TaxID=1851006 RepID=A0A0D2DWR8_9EURO|nr:hypothetical protein PV04_05866 [Phialophora macrospora]
MSPSERRLAKGERVLVTGANGYIASHVVDVLLEEGYNVRSTVRAEKPWLNKYFSDKHGPGRFETVILPAMEIESAFGDAVNRVPAVVHMASNLSVNPDPTLVIPKVVAGTLNLLKAAAVQSGVRSVVLTSSCAAAYVRGQGTGSKSVIDEDTWNEAAVEAAWSSDTPPDARGFLVYAASKVQGGKEAWKWVEENKPGFAFNTVLPPFNVGTILPPEIGGSTMGFTRQLLEGNYFVTKLLPPRTSFPCPGKESMHSFT